MDAEQGRDRRSRPYGGWLQAYAPYRSALSGSVLLTAWDNYLLPPGQALDLAAAADLAAASLAAAGTGPAQAPA